MSDKLALRIDPEFQAVYDQAGSAEVVERDEPIKGRVRRLSAGDAADDGEALINMARDNERYCDRKSFKDGSFDQIEHDVSNAGRLLFNFLTR